MLSMVNPLVQWQVVKKQRYKQTETRRQTNKECSLKISQPLTKHLRPQVIRLSPKLVKEHRPGGDSKPVEPSDGDLFNCSETSLGSILSFEILFSWPSISRDRLCQYIKHL